MIPESLKKKLYKKIAVGDFRRTKY